MRWITRLEARGLFAEGGSPEDLKREVQRGFFLAVQEEVDPQATAVRPTEDAPFPTVVGELEGRPFRLAFPLLRRENPWNTASAEPCVDIVWWEGKRCSLLGDAPTSEAVAVLEGTLERAARKYPALRKGALVTSPRGGLPWSSLLP